MIKLIFTHLRRRATNYIAVCVELTVVLLVCNILLNQLLPFIHSQRLYNNFGLSNVLCCTVTTDRETVEGITEEVGATVLWRNYRGQYALSDESLFIQPVEKGYLSRFGLVPNDEILNGPIAVVSGSLSSQYITGETYTVTVGPSVGEITFTVAASMDNDLMFIPPSGDAALSIIGYYPHTILLALDSDDLALFIASDVYTLESKEIDAQRVVDELSWKEQIVTAMSCDEAQNYSNSLDLSQMGMPIVISLTAVVLCLAGMLSNTLLSIIANERANAIYYICGYTWKKCALLQIMSDLFIVVCSAILAFAIMQILSALSGNISLQHNSFLISVAIVAAIYVLAEVFGLIHIKKKNVAEIAERMK